MQNFVERFVQVAAEHPDKTALVFQEQAMTYSQLERLSAKIASRLLRRGAKPEKIYPIILERGLYYIASMLGVLRAGAAYSPLSTEYPKDRVAYIIKDSGKNPLRVPRNSHGGRGARDLHLRLHGKSQGHCARPSLLHLRDCAAA